MTDDLIARLKKYLDEDERVALDVAYPDPESWYSEGHLAWDTTRNLAAKGRTNKHGTHIARHDPARVLRWVKAAREILDEHEPKPWVRDLSYCSCCSDKRGDSQEDWPCPTVRALASVYGDEA